MYIDVYVCVHGCVYIMCIDVLCMCTCDMYVYM
jgi:hypothetical protein